MDKHVTKLTFRKDSSANWTANNPVLALGEPGFDTTNQILKVGDGVTPWNSLKVQTGSTSSASSEPSTPIVPEIPMASKTTPGLVYFWADAQGIHISTVKPAEEEPVDPSEPVYDSTTPVEYTQVGEPEVGYTITVDTNNYMYEDGVYTIGGNDDVTIS